MRKNSFMVEIIQEGIPTQPTQETARRVYKDEFSRQLDAVFALDAGLFTASEAAKRGEDPLPILDKFKELAEEIKQTPIQSFFK